MLSWTRRLFAPDPPPAAPSRLLAADRTLAALPRHQREAAAWAKAVRAGAAPMGAMDTATAQAVGGAGALSALDDGQLEWLAGQSFIGYQACALLAQHWLIDRACTMPARDAARGGYSVAVTDGTRLPPEAMDALARCDRRHGIARHMVEFVRLGRVFGIRAALFHVDSPDPAYYEKPFNPDGIAPGSYRGIAQVDPYWMTPVLSARAATDPAAPDFHDPTWWLINGRRYHRSHLVIMRTSSPPDILKPTYQYGGVPVPQLIAQRVLAADRVANEGPALALSKRTTILHTDVERALTDQQEFEARIGQWAYFRDNYGIKVLGLDETAEQFETSLGDLDAVIMTQFQLVAAAAGVPATKLLGTTPKGFNATGAYEEAAYHEELESIQAHDLAPLLERHHLLSIRSDIAPRFGIAPFATEVVWKPLDVMTARERAEVNRIKAETDAVHIGTGVLSAPEARARVVAEADNGYSGLSHHAAPGDTAQKDDTAQEDDR